jgi:hypothetical protein
VHDWLKSAMKTLQFLFKDLYESLRFFVITRVFKRKKYNTKNMVFFLSISAILGQSCTVSVGCATNTGTTTASATCSSGTCVCPSGYFATSGICYISKILFILFTHWNTQCNQDTTFRKLYG